MNRPATPVLIAISLPLLLAVAVAAIAITARLGGLADPAPPDTRPLAVAPVDAPDASGPDCAALLAALDGDLPGPDGALPVRAIAEPIQPGVRAWAAAPRPVVLRCGLPRPVELTPTSALLEINGVRWLQLDDSAGARSADAPPGADARSADAPRGFPDPVVVTYVAVDRPVYVVLTTPIGVGSGPLQQVSDAVRVTLATSPVAVR